MTCCGNAGRTNPSLSRLGGGTRPASYACRNAGVVGSPQPGRARRSSSVDSPSDSQRGTRSFVTPNVNVWASSCHAVAPQWNAPLSRADGASIASTGPKLMPNAPRPVRPTERTEKSACVRYSSRRTGGGA